MAADATAGRSRLASPAMASGLGLAAAGLAANAVHAAFEPAHLSVWIKER